MIELDRNEQSCRNLPRNQNVGWQTMPCPAIAAATSASPLLAFRLPLTGALIFFSSPNCQRPAPTLRESV